MTPASINIPRHPRSTPAGNTLLLVLITIAVLSLVAGNLMWSASARYHVTYQSASWQEALLAAEAGVDLGMSELRKRTVPNVGTAFLAPAAPGAVGWFDAPPLGGAPTGAALKVDKRLLGGAVDPMLLSRATVAADPAGGSFPLTNHFPDYGHAVPLTLLDAATHGGEGNNQLAVRVYIDVPGSGASATNPAANPNQTFAQSPPTDAALRFITISDDGTSETDYANNQVNRSRWWWRIRAVGYAGVSGPPRPSPDKRDNLLRRFSFFNDWRSGAPALLPVNNVPAPAPQVSRLVEVIAKPITRMHYAMLGATTVDLAGQTVLVDSYDSSNGDYASALTANPSAADSKNAGYTLPGSATTPSGAKNPNAGKNIGWQGNIATNGQIINAGGANIQGDASTNDGKVIGAQNVIGAQDPNFYQELAPVAAPNWGGLTVEPTIDASGIKGTDLSGVSYDGNGHYTFKGGASPETATLLHVNGIDLTDTSKGLRTLTILPSANGASGFARIFVDGDMLTTGANSIIVPTGVTAAFSVTGSVNLNGAGIVNGSKRPSHVSINGIKPAGNAVGGPAHTITIAPYTSTSKQIGGSGKGDDDGGDGQNGNGDGKSKGGATTAGFAADFIGIIYAPQHDLILSGANSTSGQNDFAGSFIASYIRVNAHTQIHYDESLRNAGKVSSYKIVNWFEDTATHVGP